MYLLHNCTERLKANLDALIQCMVVLLDLVPNVVFGSGSSPTPLPRPATTGATLNSLTCYSHADHRQTSYSLLLK